MTIPSWLRLAIALNSNANFPYGETGRSHIKKYTDNTHDSARPSLCYLDNPLIRYPADEHLHLQSWTALSSSLLISLTSARSTNVILRPLMYIPVTVARVNNPQILSRSRPIIYDAHPCELPTGTIAHRDRAHFQNKHRSSPMLRGGLLISYGPDLMSRGSY